MIISITSRPLRWGRSRSSSTTVGEQPGDQGRPAPPGRMASPSTISAGCILDGRPKVPALSLGIVDDQHPGSRRWRGIREPGSDPAAGRWSSTGPVAATDDTSGGRGVSRQPTAAGRRASGELGQLGRIGWRGQQVLGLAQRAQKPPPRPRWRRRWPRCVPPERRRQGRHRRAKRRRRHRRHAERFPARFQAGAGGDLAAKGRPNRGDRRRRQADQRKRLVTEPTPGAVGDHRSELHSEPKPPSPASSATRSPIDRIQGCLSGRAA